VEERDEKNKRGEEKIRALRSFHLLGGVVLLNILSKQLQLYQWSYLAIEGKKTTPPMK